MTHSHVEPPPPPPIILLVEDDLDTREMYHLALESEGFWVVDAPNAASAMESALDVQPDLVVTDVGLPGLRDGVEFARTLRASARTAAIPVLAVTGRDPRGMDEAAALFSEVLLKPVLPDVLIARIRETLHQARELQQRSVDTRQRVAELLERSERTIAKSHRIYSRRAAEAFVRDCPRCHAPLSWSERRVVSGVTFDYYQRCRAGCGLYCYNHSDRTFVSLAD